MVGCDLDLMCALVLAAMGVKKVVDIVSTHALNKPLTFTISRSSHFQELKSKLITQTGLLYGNGSPFTVTRFDLTPGTSFLISNGRDSALSRLAHNGVAAASDSDSVDSDSDITWLSVTWEASLVGSEH